MQISTSVTGSAGLTPNPMGVPRRTSSASAPNLPSPQRSTSTSGQASQLTQHMAQSMTIDEMRALHNRAMTDADAKRTELRLVLASRYRELVGSSDEVIKMKERAQELNDLVKALPQLISKLTIQPKSGDETKEKDMVDTPEGLSGNEICTLQLRRELSLLLRMMYRALDNQDVHKATHLLIQLFTLIAHQTDIYPLANELGKSKATSLPTELDSTLELQIRMTFLQVQSLPDKIRRISHGMLARAASYDVSASTLGIKQSASALASLHLIDVLRSGDRAEWLLTTYYESKAKILVSLLNQLTVEGATNAEEILSKIVLILQHDIILDPYQIFYMRTFPGSDNIMNALPLFDKDLIKLKCSKFLAAHLPLIRTKVKSVLVTIAGTTASALGQIRQSLYDKTDGSESMDRFKEGGVCTWDEAVFSMVDNRTVFAETDTSQQNRFSLWGSLFSNTFSSLVHSLLTTAFQSVHTSVVSTLRNSLTNAPPVASILPHEAYRNALKIATDLDRSLLKVSEDAHKLLVHAEERVESERRLRQSLYVQTCEIMGRLICELRRMVSRSSNDTSDTTKELVVGRLCFLLKFRLSSLRTLLAPDSSPASMNSTGGMIAFVDLQSSFDLADDDEDGLISFDEAMSAVESAFSGTPFNGSEMVRETLLLSNDGKESTMGHLGVKVGTPTNVTLKELTLLTARGLRHDEVGALLTVQLALDSIVQESLRRWARSTLSYSSTVLKNSVRDALDVGSNVADDEWLRMFSGSEQRQTSSCRSVSPHFVGFLLDVGSALNGSVCPSDWLSPVPSSEYAISLGNTTPDSTCMDAFRLALLSESLDIATAIVETATEAPTRASLETSCASALMQWHVDVSFLKMCYFERNRCGFGSSHDRLSAVVQFVDAQLEKTGRRDILESLPNVTKERHQRVLETSDLFFTSIFGDALGANVSPTGELVGSAEGSDPLFYGPILSSRRFTLLPIQADRSLSDIQLRRKYAKEKEDGMDQQGPTSGNVISGGFGFLSNMLKTKK